MTRVLVVSSEPVGAQMAGPSIRALELARALSAHHEVSLAAPSPSEVDDPRIALVDAGFIDYDALSAAVAAADVVVAQELPARLLTRLPSLGTRFVADLYNPTVFEVLEAGRDKEPAARRRQQRNVALSAIAHLAAADHVVCASEKQRDLWLGVMAAAGLVDLDAYDVDPSLRSVIDVVPFGIPAVPPAAGEEPPIRARFPDIAPGDHVVLWGGGVWNWLDAETVVDAIGLLEGRRGGRGPRTHLVIMGMGRPSSERLDAMSSGDRFLAHLAASGLEGQLVHVNHGWVPYDERGGWLLESDVGISSHRDHLETRFAFRTRVLDYLWAGLPVVATRGDTLADLVESHGLGVTVPPQDPAALAAGLAAVLGDASRLAAAREAVRALAPAYRWDTSVLPLARFCAIPGGGPDRRVLRRTTLARYPLIVGETREALGVRGAVARVGRSVARAVRRH